jgi:hypothetical protein
MKKLNFVTLFSIMVVAISCVPCKNMDCKYDDYTGEFRMVDKLSGKDLVFGPSKVFDKNQIKFYSLQGLDTVKYEYFPVRSLGSGYDTLLNVRFYPGNPKVVFIKLGNDDTDTLSIEYKTYNSECCGRITELAKFRFNNSYETSGKEIQVIKK